MRSVWTCLLGWGLLACTNAGLNVALPEEAALEWLVILRNGAITILPVDRAAQDLVLGTSDEARAFVVGVSEAQLLAASADFDRDQIKQRQLEVDAAQPELCPDGVVERPAGDLIFLRIAARDVGMLYALDGADESPPPLPPMAWPPELGALSIRMPILEPCQPMRAEIGPFAGRSRLFEVGDVFDGVTLSEDDAHLFNLSAVEYLSDDRVFLAFPTALAILERGGQMSSALIIPRVSPLFPPPPQDGTYWEVMHVAIEEGNAPRREAHANLLALFPSGEITGMGFADFTVTSTSISRLRLRGFVTRDEGIEERDSLRRIAHRPGGGFAAVGSSFLVTAEASGPVRGTRVAQINGTSILYLPTTTTQALIQDRKGLWWLGDPAAPEDLLSELGGGGPFDTGGTTRMMAAAAEMRPVSGNNQGYLWHRRAPGDWQEHRWWLPGGARGCSSPAGECGRPTSRLMQSVRDVGPIGEGVVHTFDRCDAIFWTVPGAKLCSEALEIDWDEYRLPGYKVSAIAVRGRMALLAGDGGLLVEVRRD